MLELNAAWPVYTRVINSNNIVEKPGRMINFDSMEASKLHIRSLQLLIIAE